MMSFTRKEMHSLQIFLIAEVNFCVELLLLGSSSPLQGTTNKTSNNHIVDMQIP